MKKFLESMPKKEKVKLTKETQDRLYKKQKKDKNFIETLLE